MVGGLEMKQRFSYLKFKVLYQDSFNSRHIKFFLCLLKYKAVKTLNRYARIQNRIWKQELSIHP